MKVHISVDMEGATGVVGVEDVSKGTSAYEHFRRFLTKDVNAAIEGAIEAGATEIIVNEAHGSMKNLILEDINPKASVILGSTKPLGMMEGIDNSFDAAFFIGYHARAGTEAAILSHTVSLSILNININGNPIGELGMNAFIAGYFNVPIVLVTGDNKVCKEALDFIANVETVIVKEAIDQISAKCLSPATSYQMIKAAASKALKNISTYKPITCETPVNMEIEFFLPGQAAVASIIPEINRIGPRKISFTLKDYLDVIKMRTAAIRIARMNIPITF